MSDRMKILYLVGTDPRNTSYGGEQRTHFIWEGLKKVADVYTVIPVSRKSQERVDETDQIRWFCFERRWTLCWIFRCAWERFSPLWNIKWPCYFDKKKLDCFYPFAFDACVTRYVAMTSYLKAWQIAPLCVDVDDLLTAEFDSFHPLPHTFYCEVVRWFLDKYQASVFRHARHLWVSDPVHIESLKECEVFYVPNISCALSKTYKGNVSPAQVLLFVGALNCSQNYDGVDYFLSEYWARLLSRFPNLQFKIAGNGLPSRFEKKWIQYRNVEVLGFVKDLHPYYERCMGVVVPVYKGTGSCIKVIEALSAGRVCIGTPHAFRGIDMAKRDATNGILVFHDGNELANAIQKICDYRCRGSMQEGGFQFIQDFFTQHQVDTVIKGSFSRWAASVL
jgi:glycosyltransferase involved in cell wall biosynthesis